MNSNTRYQPSVFDVWALVFTAVSTGIYSVWSSSADVGFGNVMIIVFLVIFMYGSLVCSLAEISSALSINGGAYGLARFSLGFFPGFLVGSFEAMEYIVNVTTCVVTFSNELALIWPVLSPYQPWIMLVTYIFLSVFYIAFPGKPFWRFVALQSVVVTILLAVFVLGSIPFVNFAQYAQNGLPAFAAPSAAEFYSAFPAPTSIFFGIEALIMLNDSARSPRQTIPRAYLWTFISLAVFAILVIPIAFSLPPGQATLATQMVPVLWGYQAMFNLSAEMASILTLPTFFCTCFCLMFTYEKLIFSMADSALLPEILTWRTSQGAPYAANICGSVISFGLCLISWNSYATQEFLYNLMLVFGFMANACQLWGYILLKLYYFQHLDKTAEFKRSFFSPFGLYGAATGLVLALLFTISAIFLQGQVFLMVGTTLVYLLLLSIVYRLYARSRQTFSKNEREILYVLHVIKFERLKLNRKKGKINNKRTSVKDDEQTGVVKVDNLVTKSTLSKRYVVSSAFTEPENENLSPIDYFLKYKELPSKGVRGEEFKLQVIGQNYHSDNNQMNSTRMGAMFALPTSGGVHPLEIDSNIINNINITNVLESEAGLNSFTAHCVREFNMENLLFWRECQKFKSMRNSGDNMNTERLAAEAERLLNLYVVDNAPNQINLPGTVRLNLIRNITDGNIKLETFDEALSEVLFLMEKDSFARYKKSDLFRDYVIQNYGSTNHGDVPKEVRMTTVRTSVGLPAAMSPASSLEATLDLTHEDKELEVIPLEKNS